MALRTIELHKTNLGVMLLPSPKWSHNGPQKDNFGDILLPSPTWFQNGPQKGDLEHFCCPAKSANLPKLPKRAAQLPKTITSEISFTCSAAGKFLLLARSCPNHSNWAVGQYYLGRPEQLDTRQVVCQNPLLGRLG